MENNLSYTPIPPFFQLSFGFNFPALVYHILFALSLILLAPYLSIPFTQQTPPSHICHAISILLLVFYQTLLGKKLYNYGVSVSTTQDPPVSWWSG
jgi:hypothetical protein